MAPSSHLLASHLSSSLLVILYLLLTITPNYTIHAGRTLSSAQNGDGAVTVVDLIHRDYSPRSAFYDPSLTPAERWTLVANRSNARARYISQLLSPRTTLAEVKPPIHHLVVSYLVELAIGTPPITVQFIVDTGSELTWTQCMPCGNNCYPSVQSIYDPSKSSSYIPYPCPSFMCDPSMYSYPTQCVAGACGFRISYADGSGVNGTLASETLTFDTEPYEYVPFGCASQTRGPVGIGLLGLGNSPMGFAYSSKVGRKFATCLTPTVPNRRLDAAGRLLIGGAGEGTAGMVSTPMVDPADHVIYRARITRAFVREDALVDFGFVVLVDSGTTNTYMPGVFMDAFEELVRNDLGLKPVASPSEVLYHYCYQVPIGPRPDLPPLVFTFDGPVNVTLLPETAFHWMSDGMMVCLNLLSADKAGTLPIWGDSAMANFLVGYDLEAKKINFTPMECADF